MAVTTVRVPLFNEVYRNVDGISLSDKSYMLIDGYLDEEGHTVKRPGLSLFADLGLGTNKPIDGVYFWSMPQTLWAVCAGRLFRVSHEGAYATVTEITGASLIPGHPATFCTDGMTLYVANGGRIVQTTDSGPASYITDTDAPMEVTHVAFVDGYLLANKVHTNLFFWSDLNTPTVWNALNFAQAAGKADHIAALRVQNREIFLIGAESTEIWENNGETPFERIAGGYIESGCIAPHSVVSTENDIYWLDDERHIIKWSSGRAERLSTPYDREIESFPVVSDCRAFRIEKSGRTFLNFTFPSIYRSLVFDVLRPNWAEWRHFDSAAMRYDGWIGSCSANCSPWAVHVVGSRRASILYTISPDYKSDDGEPIRVQRITGHIDFGTLQTKRSKQLRIRAKRGEGFAPSLFTPLPQQAPVVMVRWRDNNAAWSNEHHLNIGKLGDEMLVLRMHRTGIFRTRQYEITASDAVSINFGDAEEDIEILR